MKLFALALALIVGNIFRKMGSSLTQKLWFNACANWKADRRERWLGKAFGRAGRNNIRQFSGKNKHSSCVIFPQKPAKHAKNPSKMALACPLKQQRQQKNYAMKKSMILCSAFALIASFSIVSCDNAKKDSATENEAERLEEENKELQAEFQKEYDELSAEYTREMEENQRKMDALREEARNTKQQARRDSIEKNIEELKQRNENAKTRWQNFRYESKENWQEFKREFRHDMNSIKEGLNDLGENNKN